MSNSGEELILDVRNEDEQAIGYWKINLNKFDVTPLSTPEVAWWSSLEAYDGGLFIAEYEDSQDPNKKQFYMLDNEKVPVENDKIQRHNHVMETPFVYGPGTEYHNTVKAFLGLELPLSCEYAEYGNKIIMCYYLRSDNGFDRYLLILDSGKKVLKEHIDHNMSGFAPGAFFTYLNKLFFIRNRDEICIYPF